MARPKIIPEKTDSPAKPYEVLLIGGSDDIQNTYARDLTDECYAVTEAFGEDEAFRFLHRHRPDIVLINLPPSGLAGLEVCAQIRQSLLWRKLPVIVLDSSPAEDRCVVSLRVGADDYIARPFGTTKLTTRMVAVLRRSSQNAIQPQKFEFEDMALYPQRHLVTRGVKEISLTSTEFKILQHMITDPGVVLTRAEAEAKYTNPTMKDERSLDSHIKRMRRRLGKPDLIDAISGVGYRLLAPKP